MPYHVRPMHLGDIPQVTEIDRKAFPNMWPPANYQRELKNRLAHYNVAYDDEKIVEELMEKSAPEKGFSGMASKVKQLFNHNRFFGNGPTKLTRQYILGFAGFWIMADEVHIISIAVREDYRRLGIGESLLISTIDQAAELTARIITLEVRASNIDAQNLYRKYGFNTVGLRRGYYTDNKEDAVLMTLEDITSASFQRRLNQLKQAHFGKLGIPIHQFRAAHPVQPSNE